jgi:hypothetical protein
MRKPVVGKPVFVDELVEKGASKRTLLTSEHDTDSLECQEPIFIAHPLLLYLCAGMVHTRRTRTLAKQYQNPCPPADKLSTSFAKQYQNPCPPADKDLVSMEAFVVEGVEPSEGLSPVDPKVLDRPLKVYPLSC